MFISRVLAPLFFTSELSIVECPSLVFIDRVLGCSRKMAPHIMAVTISIAINCQLRLPVQVLASSSLAVHGQNLPRLAVVGCVVVMAVEQFCRTRYCKAKINRQLCGMYPDGHSVQITSSSEYMSFHHYYDTLSS